MALPEPDRFHLSDAAFTCELRRRERVAEEGFERVEERALLGSLMSELTPRDRLVVRLRFERDLTQQQIGDHVGISQMQVSRILRRCLGRLQARAGAADTGELALR